MSNQNEINFYMMIWPGTSVGHSKLVSLSKVEKLKEYLNDWHGAPFGCGNFEVGRYENNSWISDKNFGTRHIDVNSQNFIRIIIRHPPQCQCPFYQDCIKTIADGKCTDEFIKSTIGKIFFSKQYSN